MAERLIDQLDFIRTASPKQLYERVQQKALPGKHLLPCQTEEYKNR